MRIVGYTVCFIAVMTIGAIIFYPMVNWLTDDGMVQTIIYTTPFLAIMATPLVFIGFSVVGSSTGHDNDNEEDTYAITEKYEYERKRMSAEESLKNKYVKGVVTDLDYTQKMSRL